MLNPTVRIRKGLPGKMATRTRSENFVDMAERATKAAAEQIAKSHDAIKQSFGDRPFGTSKTDTDHKLDAYETVRQNDVAWGALITKVGLAKAIQYALHMEKLVARRHSGSGTESDYTALGLGR